MYFLKNLKFVNKCFFKSKFSVIVGLISPVILMIILASIVCIPIKPNINEDGDITTNIFIFSPLYSIPSLSVIPILFMCLIAMPIIIFDIRRTDILLRTSLAKNKTSNIFFAVLFYFFILCVMLYYASFFTSALFSFIVSHDAYNFVEYLIINANYWENIYSVVVYAALAVLIGALIGSLCKRIITMQIISMSLIMYTCFFGGAIIPLQYLAVMSKNDSSDIWILTYFSPFKYATMPLMESWCQGPVGNGGTLDWTPAIFDGLDGHMTWERISKYGHSSIFDFNHAFVTNLFQTPLINYHLNGYDGTLNTWYIKNDAEKSYCLIGALWAFVWLNIEVPGVLKELLNIQGIEGDEKFNFATCWDKVLDIFIPLILIMLLALYTIYMSRQRLSKREASY
ncbi:MAG: hypothetical protein LBM76_03275 [Mycoplasmataceae bacterium]|nr:hypothetical protein [Mycoplasmataceae bacterium]